MKIAEFYNPAQDAEIVSFSELGTAVEGTLVAEPEFIADKFNADGKVLVIALDTDKGMRKVFARRSQTRAIGAALKAAGVEELAAGGWLRLAYVSDRETPNGTAKVYTSEYRPGVPSDDDGPIGVGTLADAQVDPWADDAAGF